MPLVALAAGAIGIWYFTRTKLCVSWENGTCKYTLKTSGKSIEGIVNPLLQKTEAIPVGENTLLIESDGTGWVTFDVKNSKGNSILTVGNSGLNTCESI